MSRIHNFSEKLEEIWQKLSSRWNCGSAQGFHDIYIHPMKQHTSDFEKRREVFDAAVTTLEEKLSALEQQVKL